MAYQPKSYRKFIAGAATAAVVASVVTPAAAAANFEDVPASYKEAVDFLVSKGINGTSETTFGTQQNIKRVDAAVMVANVLGLDLDAAPDAGFTDVPERAVKHVNALKAAGITNGKTETTFASDQEITRGELAIWLQRGFELEAGEGELAFTDVADRYKEAVSALVAAEVTNGTSETTFGTTDNAKRGGFAKFLLRADEAQEQEVVVPGVVESVSATTTTVDAAKDTEQLEFTINNGTKATVQDLLNNGYEVTFKIVDIDNKDVVDAKDEINNDEKQSENGKIVFDGAKTGDKFKYQVEVSKNNESIFSNVQEVEIVDSFNKANSINVAELKVGNIENESGVLTLDDTNIRFTEVEYTNSEKVKKSFTSNFEDNKVKFTSSNPEVAVISKEGVITLVNTGKTTITVEVAGLKKEVSITVKDEERKPATVTAEYSTVKLAPSTTRDVEFVVRDQFGDALEGVTLEAQALKVDGDTVARLSFAGANGTLTTDEEGKVEGTLAGSKAGKGNLYVYAQYDGKTTASLVKLPVEVTGVSNVDSYKLEKVDADDSFELDAYDAAYDDIEDQKVTLRVNEYNSVGTLVGKVDLTDTTDDITVEIVEKDADGDVVSTGDIISVDDASGDLEITPAGDNVEGTATVYVKEDGLTIASQVITVVNTTPEITAIAFNTVGQVTETSPIEVKDVISTSKVTVDNKQGIVRLGDITVNNTSDYGLYLDLDNNNSFDNDDIVIGTVDIEQYGEFDNTLSINTTDEEIGTFAAGDEGTVIVKVTGTTGAEKTFTTSLDVKIPE